MLDVQNPEIDVDDIMRRIQEKVRIAAAQPIPRPPPEASAPAQSMANLNQHLAGRIHAIEQDLSGARNVALKLDHARTAIGLQERRLTAFLEEAQKRLGEPLDREQLQAFAAELPRVADAAYLHFEDLFRGSP